MILYSIVPPEVVFANAQDESPARRVEIEWKGEKVEARELGNNRYVIERLISTSPKAFLNPDLQPGTVIENFMPARGGQEN